jgi:hypothetical protein
MMANNMNKEVDDFLHSVEALTEADLLPVPPPVNATSSEDDEIQEESSEKEDVADKSTSTVATKGKTKGNRHRWKHQNLVGEYYDKTTKSTRYCNTFLDDRNTQDLLFSELLMSEQPYRAAAKTKALENFVLKMRSTVDTAGRKPLALITSGTYRKRVALYQTLAEYWSDKTGPVLANGTALGDEWRIKDYKDMTVSEKIAFNVENYIDDNKALEEEERVKAEATAKKMNKKRKTRRVH